MAGKKKSLTKEYVHALGDVYHEKGVLAAIGYEIKSTLYSLSTRLDNLFEPRSSWSNDPVREREERVAFFRVEEREADRERYLLRGKKKDLSTRVPIFILFLIGGIAISTFSLTATGNAVGNLTGTTQGLLGLILFVVGIFGIVFSKR